MDLDAYVSAKEPTWKRLEELAARRNLTGAETDEIIDTYQRVATHLSVIRSSAPDAAIVSYLSALLARARTASAGTRVSTWAAIGRYFLVTFPAALYATRYWWLTTMLVSTLATIAWGWWLLENPHVEASLLRPAEVDDLVQRGFADYYTENAASAFAFRVWTNNFWLAATCIAFGVFGLPVLWVLWRNVENLAVTGSIMIGHGRADVFFGLITPHGLLELTCLFVAAGVGLRVFWSWISPGAQPRLRSLAQHGRAAIGIALGLVVLLLISGIIEAFVTPSPLPTWARVGVGVVVWAAFFVYVFTLGRWAHDAGERGDVAPDEREFFSPTA